MPSMLINNTCRRQGLPAVERAACAHPWATRDGGTAAPAAPALAGSTRLAAFAESALLEHAKAAAAASARR